MFLNAYILYCIENIYIPMLLAKRIAAIRKNRGLTQMEMADRLDISQSSYARYEKSASNLRFKTIIKIAEVLDVSVGYLCSIDEANDSASGVS